MDAEPGNEAFRIGLDALRFKPSVPAGMNIFTLASLVPLLRNTALDHDPIFVDACCPTCGCWRVQDGRHRFVAAVMAGRHDVLARRDPDGEHGQRF